jgi:DNA repair photolyase
MLNPAKGNMYSFITHTWNTVKGACPHECSYCYMKRFGKQRPVRFDAKEMKTDLGEDNYIFVGSSCDMFAEDIYADWIFETLDKCHRAPNKYLFQSKNPRKMAKFQLPESSIICTTIETNYHIRAIMGHSPTPTDRAIAMQALDTFPRYVTIEPIMAFNLAPLVDLIKRCDPIQVNIGADSGRNGLPEPTRDEVIALIEELKEFTAVKAKDNLSRIIHVK